MDRNELPPEVRQLAELGDPWELNELIDYREKGIGPQHVDALLDVVRNTVEIWESVDPQQESPEEWFPLHAWRALAQLQALDAMPTLLDTLNLIEKLDSDLVQEEMPEVFAKMGPAALPNLEAFVLDTGKEMWARLAAAEGMQIIATDHNETRDQVVGTIVRALEGYEREDPTFNGFMINFLLDLRAIEAAPAVEKVYQANQVDLSILGDGEDFQVGIGLLEKRITPIGWLPGGDGWGNETARVNGQKEDTKTKKKRKQAKASRQKNRKKKKKK